MGQPQRGVGEADVPGVDVEKAGEPEKARRPYVFTH